jgi:ferrous iron transport protein B
MFSITLGGWAAALIVARILRSTLIKGEPTPFVMELPPYRWPTFSGMVIHTWERTWQYIKKAGTVILGISILIWALMTFPGLPDEKHHEFEDRREALAAQNLPDEEAEEAAAEIDNDEAAAALEGSFAGRLGRTIEPLTAPAGFNWQTNIALIGGVAAKEVVVATLGTAYSLGAVDEESASLEDRIKADPHWTMANAVSLIVFTLLYSPCFVTLLVIKQETARWRWTFFSLFFDLGLAWVMAILAYQIMS